MRHHLLVVDDDPEICSVLQLGLEQDENCRTTGASTVEEARKVLSNDRPDAAVLDVMLRGGCGLKLASHAIDLGVPVLIMTGHPDTHRELDGLNIPFLAKPFRLDELHRQVQAVLSDHAQHLRRMGELMERLRQNRAVLAEALAVSRETIARALSDADERAKRGS